MASLFGINGRTMNLRRHAINLLQRPRGPQPLILMYHRIADVAVDPWGLAVSPTRFQEQLDLLCRVRTPLSLVDLIDRLEKHTLPPNAVAVTFDDGYVDNLFAAKPHLAAAGVPATIFLPTGCLGRTREFWWDEFARLILSGRNLRKLSFKVRGAVMSLDLTEEPLPDGAHSWRAWEKPLTARHARYLATWRVLRPLSDAEREPLMAEIRSVFETPVVGEALSRPMTMAEVRTLVSDSLISIGAHSVTHPSLTTLDKGARNREISESKRACENLVGKPVDGFAYPYGDFDDEVRKAVQANGFTYAVAANNATVTAKSDRLALPRLQVLNWDGETLEKAISATRFPFLNRVAGGWPFDQHGI